MEDLEGPVQQAKSRADRWSQVAVVPQAAENADTRAQSAQKWAKIYSLFKARGEAQQDEVFAAVNYYFLRNGASPSGKYTKPIRTAGGTEVESGALVQITGRQPGEIRQFLRGRLEDSVMFLRYNPAIKQDPDLIAIAENAGVEKEYCWLLADWLGRDCPHLWGAEPDVYNALRTSKIAAAYNKRETAAPEVDRVKQNAPESKVKVRSPASRGGAYNEELF